MKTNIQADAPGLAKSNATTLSDLLNLPAEVRNFIWKLCQPTADELELNVCLCNSGERCTYDMASACIALSSLKKQNDLIRSIRSLLLVNRQVYAETEPFMRYGKTLVFCDDLCMRDFIMAMPLSERRLVASIKVNHVVEVLSMEHEDVLVANDALHYSLDHLGECWEQIALSHYEVVVYDHEIAKYDGVRFARVTIAVDCATSEELEW